MSNQIITLADVISDGTATIEHDSYDVGLWRFLGEHHPPLRQYHHDNQQKYHQLPDLTRDLFWLCWKSSAQPRDDFAISHILNARMTGALINSADFAELQKSTQGNVVASMLVSVQLSRMLMNKLSRALRDKARRAQQAQREAESAYACADSWRTMAQHAPNPQAHDQVLIEAQQAEQQGDQLAKELEALGNSMENSKLALSQQELADHVQDVTAMVQELLEQAASFMQSWGDGMYYMCDGAANPETILFVINVLQHNPKLVQIALMLGRMHTLAIQKQRVSADIPVEFVSVEIGNQINRTLETDIALLSDTETEDIFYQRYAESKLLQKKLQYKQEQSKGPVICVTDCSYSMIGDRENWAKAVELALLKIAQRQKRDFVAMHFSDYDQLRVFEHPKGDASLQDMLNMADHFLGGQTDYDNWMQRAMSYVESAQYDKADVILLSDGLPSRPSRRLNDWSKMREERGVNVLAVYISTDRNYPVPEILTRMCDKVYLIADLVDDTAQQALSAVFSV